MLKKKAKPTNVGMASLFGGEEPRKETPKQEAPKKEAPKVSSSAPEVVPETSTPETGLESSGIKNLEGPLGSSFWESIQQQSQTQSSAQIPQSSPQPTAQQDRQPDQPAIPSGVPESYNWLRCKVVPMQPHFNTHAKEWTLTLRLERAPTESEIEIIKSKEVLYVKL